MQNEVVKIDLSGNLEKAKAEAAKPRPSTPVLNERTPKFPGKIPKILVPFIFYWEEMKDGMVYMTAAFEWYGKKFGETWPKGTTNREAVLNKTHLLGIMRDTLCMLEHHGKKVLDQEGNIDPRKVNDQEAIQYEMDPLYDKKIEAFNQACKIKEITKDQAQKIGLMK